MVYLVEWVYRWNSLGLNSGIFQRTLCFAARRTVILTMERRKVFKTSTFGQGAPLASQAIYSM